MHTQVECACGVKCAEPQPRIQAHPRVATPGNNNGAQDSPGIWDSALTITMPLEKSEKSYTYIRNNSFINRRHLADAALMGPELQVEVSTCVSTEHEVDRSVDANLYLSESILSRGCLYCVTHRCCYVELGPLSLIKGPSSRALHSRY